MDKETFNKIKGLYENVISKMTYSRDLRLNFDAFVVQNLPMKNSNLPIPLAAVVWAREKTLEPYLVLGEQILRFAPKEVEWIIAHEVGHILLNHSVRFPNFAKWNQYTGKVWNYATDAIINSRYGIYDGLKKVGSSLADSMITVDNLRKSGIDIYVTDSEVKIFKRIIEKVNEELDKVAEEGGLMGKLASNIKNNLGGESTQSSSNPGESEDPVSEDGSQGGSSEDPVSEDGSQGGSSDEQDPSDGPQNERDLMDQIMNDLFGGIHELDEVFVEEDSANKQDIADTSKYFVEVASKSAGNSPAEYKQDIEILLRPPLIDWKRLIKRGVQASLRKYTTIQFHKLNKRHNIGFDRGKGLGAKVLVLTDTSGSMSDKTLSFLFSEVKRAFKVGEIYLAQYDYGLQSYEKLRSLKDKITVKGRGGTSVTKCIEDMLEKHIPIDKFDSVFVLSDFYDDIHYTESPFGKASVKWIKTDSGSMTPNFGVVIDIQEQIKEANYY